VKADADLLPGRARGASQKHRPPSHEELSCPDLETDYLDDMPSTIAAKSPRRSSGRIKSANKLAGSEINDRLAQIELATVSSLRALQMDIDGDEGVSSVDVLKKARQALR